MGMHILRGFSIMKFALFLIHIDFGKESIYYSLNLLNFRKFTK